MDIPVHNELLWEGCHQARRLTAGQPGAVDPVLYFPVLARGSWINDTNQVTVFSDTLQKQLPQVSSNVRGLFAGMWQLELGKLGQEITKGHRDGALGPADLAAAQSHANQLADIRDFGNYDAHDHLDILEDKPEKEYVGGAVAATVQATLYLLRQRLRTTTIGQSAQDRRNPAMVSILGRALHTVQDFYAHTNYVELLLWDLGLNAGNDKNRQLDPSLVEACNRPSRALADWGEAPWRCLLPGVNGQRTGPGAIMWYGPSPAETPLVSSVFDTGDTIYSLLHIYSEHLRRTTHSLSLDEELDVLMAIFDVPGKPLIRGAVRLIEKVREVFDIGRWVRGWFAGRLRKEATQLRGSPGDNAQAASFLETTANLVEKYQSAEATDWARAGRLDYLAMILRDSLGRPLRDQTLTAKQLPHHTLLSKDHLPETDEARVRFAVACALAARLTAKLLVWHFSADPTADQLDDLLRTHLVHPSAQLDNGLDRAKAAQMFNAAHGARWSYLGAPL